jgi:hypothetical protein
MFRHLFGRGHLEKTVQREHPDDPDYIGMSRGRLDMEVSYIGKYIFDFGHELLSDCFHSHVQFRVQFVYLNLFFVTILCR